MVLSRSGFVRQYDTVRAKNYSISRIPYVSLIGGLAVLSFLPALAIAEVAYCGSSSVSIDDPISSSMDGWVNIGCECYDGEPVICNETDEERPEPPVKAPFRYPGLNNEYPIKASKLPAKGAVKALSTKTPAAEQDARAECVYSTYVGNDLQYWVELAEVCSDIPNMKKFAVNDVYLAGPPADYHVAELQKQGFIAIWDELSEDVRDPVNIDIWNYFNAIDPANARKRYSAAHMLYQITLWHERQHEAHQRRYREARAAVYNSPKAPLFVYAVDAAAANAEVKRAIEKDRDQKIALLNAMTHSCIEEFHKVTYAADHINNIVRQCFASGSCSKLPATLEVPVSWMEGSCRFELK